MEEKKPKNSFIIDYKQSTTKKYTILESITTIHGTNNLSQKKGVKAKLWLALMLTNGLLTIAFIFVIRDRFNSDQIVTKIISDYEVNHVPFPAVSICNFNMVSLNESRSIVNILNNHNRTTKEIKKFLRDIPSLKSFGLESRRAGKYIEIMKILKSHYFNMETIMEEVHQKCENLLIYCEFNNKPKDCTKIFRLIQTYDGHCCAFNYAALSDGNEEPPMLRDDDFEYYYDQGSDEKVSTNIIGTSQSGKSSGLRVVMNVEPSDYPSWSLIPSYGAKILINDPNDFPENSVVYSYIALDESLDVKVAPMVFQSEANLRRIPPEKRQCWFHDEALLEHTDRYSFETCHTECKMRNYLQHCGCIPYKYPREKSTRTCELEDLKCLNNVTVYWSEEKRLCNPPCYFECNDKSYSITSDSVPFLADLYPAHVTKGRNSSELSALQVYFAKSTCNCYKTSILIDFTHLIATYGGLFSLSFGGSLITIFEMTYLLLSSFVRMMWKIVLIIFRKFRNMVVE